MTKFAAIDIGSNAARLLVGEVSTKNNKFFIRKVSYTRLPLRLGEEVFETGIISEEKEEIFIKTMKAFALIASIFEVKELRACATSAMRDAKNKISVLENIKKETGIDVEIISGEEEARLISKSFHFVEHKWEESSILIDVGGGSTELTFYTKGQKTHAKSFDLGTLRILKGKFKANSWDNLSEWILDSKTQANHVVYGTGGNINKIHKLLGKKEGVEIQLSELKELNSSMQKLSNEERISIYHLKPDRADVIVPALQIYQFCLEKIECKNIFVPKVGLSDGIIFDLFDKTNQK